MHAQNLAKDPFQLLSPLSSTRQAGRHTLSTQQPHLLASGGTP
jgi:hypothetical protein